MDGKIAMMERMKSNGNYEESLKNRWKKNRTSMEELPMMEHIKTNRKSI